MGQITKTYTASATFTNPGSTTNIDSARVIGKGGNGTAGDGTSGGGGGGAGGVSEDVNIVIGATATITVDGSSSVFGALSAAAGSNASGTTGGAGGAASGGATNVTGGAGGASALASDGGGGGAPSNTTGVAGADGSPVAGGAGASPGVTDGGTGGNGGTSLGAAATNASNYGAGGGGGDLLGGAGGTGSPGFVRVVFTIPTATFTHVTPSGTNYGGGTAFTIHGTNFTKRSDGTPIPLTINGTAANGTWSSDTEITFTSPSLASQQPGTKTIVITWEDGSTTSLSNAITSWAYIGGPNASNGMNGGMNG